MRTALGVKRSWSVVMVSMLVLAACGDDDGGGTTETVTQLIGPSGGTVELSSGAKVSIPAGALSADVEITITKLNDDDVAPMPDNLEATGKPYAFKPHGQQFAEPVKIEVPYEGADVDVRPMKLPNEAADTSQWTTVFPNEKDTVNNKIAGNVTSFSVLQAARPRRNSGVITLPDGAIAQDAGEDAGGTGGIAGNAGEGGTGGIAGEGGSGGIAGSGGDAAIAGTGGSSDDDAGVIAGSGGGSGIDDGGVSCNGEICNGVCINTFSDVSHCGACDNRCGEGEQCLAGACECPVDNRCGFGNGDHDAGMETDAGSGEERYVCANFELNRFHCGACNNACITGETCLDGACTPITCDSGEIRCGNGCVDPDSDIDNCGGCAARGEDHQDPGLSCYVEDYYCGYDCWYYYGGELCSSATQPGYDDCRLLQSDRNNCGACNVTCTGTEECVLGACVALTCGAGEVACDGLCISGDSCGSSCGNNATCDVGECTCNSGTTECSTSNGVACADLDTDAMHCGACGYACEEGEECVAGTCECAGVNPASCEGWCADLDSDQYNCGACYNYCNETEQCIAGECVPPPCEGNLVRCDGSCVDPQTDLYHCGGCAPIGLSTGGETCYQGENCFCSSYGLTECALGGNLATCTDTQFDREHCGQCGNACATGTECVEGTCAPIDCGARTLCGNTCVDSPACGVRCNLQGGELCGGGLCYQGT